MRFASSDAICLNRLRTVLLLMLACMTTGVLTPDRAHAQQSDTSHASQRPGADPADVESPAAIVAAAYDVISGPAREARDWDRFRSLFLPEARLIPTGRSPNGESRYRVFTVEQFIENARQTFATQGFYERELHAETERFGDMAHVFSTYESRHSPGDSPFARGINSFQLWYDGDRWWIVDIFWHSERDGAPIPEHYESNSG